MATVAKYTGENACVKLGDNKILKLNSWKITIKGNIVDTTSFDDGGWEDSEVSTKAWEPSLEGVFKRDDKAGQMELIKQIAVGEKLETDFFTNSTDTLPDFRGKILVESADIDTSVKGEIKISFKLKGCGKLEGVDAPITV